LNLKIQKKKMARLPEFPFDRVRLAWTQRINTQRINTQRINTQRINNSVIVKSTAMER